LFSVRESGKFQGFARVYAPSDPRLKVNWVLPQRMSAELLSSPFRLDWITKYDQFLEIEYKSGEALCRLFPHDASCDVSTAISRIRLSDDNKERRGDRRPISSRLNTTEGCSRRVAGVPRLIGIQSSGGAGLLGPAGASNIKGIPNGRRGVIGSGPFGQLGSIGLTPQPLMQVNAAAAAMAAASALAAMSSNQSSLATAIARNNSGFGNRAFVGMAGLRPHIPPLIPTLPSVPKTCSSAALLNTPGLLTAGLGAHGIPNLMQASHLQTANSAAAFARALQHMGNVNHSALLRGIGNHGASGSLISSGALHSGADNSASGMCNSPPSRQVMELTTNFRRRRSVDSDGSYDGADRALSRRIKDDDYFAGDSNNSRSYDALRRVSPQVTRRRELGERMERSPDRRLKLNILIFTSGRYDRSRSRSIPVDPDALITWDTAQIRAGVGRLDDESDMMVSSP
ncbi:unnamed protein product, partial [Protopolystoma xenopodis]